MQTKLSTNNNPEITNCGLTDNAIIIKCLSKHS